MAVQATRAKPLSKTGEGTDFQWLDGCQEKIILKGEQGNDDQ